MRWMILCSLLFIGCAHAKSANDVPNNITEGQAKMPTDFINKRVDQLQVGQQGYVFKEAIKVDLDHYVWIDPEFPIQDEASSIYAKLLVNRMENGFVVTIPKEFSETWTPRISNDQCSKWGYKPVMKLILSK